MRDYWAFVFLGIFLTLAASPAAHAQDEYASVRDELDSCFECHGPKGASTNPEIPILAGQHLHYLYVQLKDFKAERRADPVMSDIAKGLEKDRMLKIATFFSEQKWPNIDFMADPAKAARGKRSAASGQCAQCHRGGYEGDSRIPRVAGQYYEYLKKTMMDFKTKARANSPAKNALMESYDEADIAAMAEFLAGM